MGGLTYATLFLALVPQASREKRIEDFKEERTKLLLECGQRHLEYGLELRKKGLTVQSAAQIVLAVDVSEEKHDGANFVLGIMRYYEDAFWKKRRTQVTEAKLAAYEKKAFELRVKDNRDRLELVRRAEARDLDGHAYQELKGLLLSLDEPLVFDAKKQLVLPGGTLDGPLAERIDKETIYVNGKPYVRDLFLERLPELTRLYEATGPTLRVRTNTSVAEAEDLLKAGTQLFEQLGAELGAVPDHRLQLFVLAERKHYERYLDISGLSSYKAADGFADRQTDTAMLCKEGSDAAHVLGLALHELTHLFQLSVTAATLPSWFLEGSAECFGGEDTFAWDGTTLSVRRPMRATRLDDVRAEPFALKELLTLDALDLFTVDRTRQRTFYAQAWALVSFLESEAAADYGERFSRWRSMCFGSAIGTDFQHPYESDEQKSEDLFLAQFEQDLPALEKAFQAWLASPATTPPR
ncbi:MAG: hypothetical protein ABL998_05545 [Planctomycetota bacterium]